MLSIYCEWVILLKIIEYLIANDDKTMSTIFCEKKVLYSCYIFPYRLDDRIPLEGANEPEQVSLKVDTDILQSALAENDTPYYDVSR